MKTKCMPGLPRFAAIAILFAFATGFSQNICGSLILGAQSEQKAKEQALSSLAQSIYSTISVESKTVETIDGIESKMSDTTNASIQSRLSNAQMAKYETKKTSDGWQSKACMTVADAAKPYLDALKLLSAKLLSQTEGKTSCAVKFGEVLETYSGIQKAESALIPLGQTDYPLQKEHIANFEKAKAEHRECLKQSGKGVAVTSGSKSLEKQIGSLISKAGGTVNKNPEMAVLTLNIKAEECDVRMDDPIVYCSACVEIEIENASTGKSLYSNSFTGKKEGWSNKAKSCQKAFESVVPEIWEQIKETLTMQKEFK